MEIIQIIISIIFLLFIPGFFVSHIFFKEKEIDIIERIALSFALSVAIVPLLAFYLNIMGVKINIYSVSFVISIVLFISILTLLIQNEKNKRKFKK